MALDPKADLQSVYIPFIGNTLLKDGAPSADQIFLNGVFDNLENPATGQKTLCFTGRPGLNRANRLLLSANPKNLFYWEGNVVTGTGAGLYATSDTGIYNSAGTPLASGGTYTFLRFPWAVTNQSATTQYAGVMAQEGLYLINTSGNIVHLSNVQITSVSAANPAVVTTATAHNLGSGTYVYLRGVTGSTPDVNGTLYQATVLSPTTFSIPVNCTVAGAGGDMGFPIPATSIAGPLVEMNGYFFALTKDGRIFNCEFNDPLSWSNSKFITCQLYSGEWVGLSKQNNFILAFSKKAIQTFVDVSNTTGSPLENYESGAQRVGCLYGSSISTEGAYTFWMGVNKSGGLTVYKTEGLSRIEEVAPAGIRRLLSLTNFPPPSSAAYYKVGRLMRIHGKLLYVLLAEFANVNCLVYDVESNIWGFWKWAGNMTVREYAGNSDGDLAWMYATDGYAYPFPGSTYAFTDNENNYEFSVTTSPIDLGTQKRKFLKRLFFVGRSATPASYLLNVSYSDDNYYTFSTPRQVSVGNGTTFLPLGGNFRRRVYKFSVTNSGGEKWFGFELVFRLGQD